MKQTDIDHINTITFYLSNKNITYEIMLSKELFWIIFDYKTNHFIISFFLKQKNENYSIDINGNKNFFTRFDGFENYIKKVLNID